MDSLATRDLGGRISWNSSPPLQNLEILGKNCPWIPTKHGEHMHAPQKNLKEFSSDCMSFRRCGEPLEIGPLRWISTIGRTLL